MQVSLRRSLFVRRVLGAAIIVALGSMAGLRVEFAKGQAPAAATPAATIAAPVEAKPAKEMNEGVKLDGATPIDLTALRAGPPAAFNRLRAVVIPVLGGQVAQPTQQDLDNVDTFIIWKTAEMTWPPNQPEARRALFKTREPLKLPNLTVQMHDRINDLLLVNLPRMISDKEYSLAVRHNCMILLGQLDKTEFGIGIAAEPLAKAEPMLLGAANSPDLPEVLRIAAYMGLARHAELLIPTNNPNRGAIAKLALDVLKAETPPPGFSLNGFHWIRKLSLQIVMGLNENGGEAKGSEYIKEVMKILTNDRLPLFLRRDAALALGHFDSTTIATAARPADVLKALTNLTIVITRAGSPRVDPAAKPDLAVAEDVMQKPTDEPSKKAFADAVAYHLNCVATGLGGRKNTNRGLIGASTDPTKKQAKDLVDQFIDPVVLLMGKSTLRTEEALAQIADKHSKIEAWAGQNNLIAAPAGDPPAAPPAAGTQQTPPATGPVFASPRTP